MAIAEEFLQFYAGQRGSGCGSDDSKGAPRRIEPRMIRVAILECLSGELLHREFIEGGAALGWGALRGAFYTRLPV